MTDDAKSIQIVWSFIMSSCERGARLRDVLMASIKIEAKIEARTGLKRAVREGLASLVS